MCKCRSNGSWLRKHKFAMPRERGSLLRRRPPSNNVPHSPKNHLVIEMPALPHPLDALVLQSESCASFFEDEGSISRELVIHHRLPPAQNRERKRGAKPSGGECSTWPCRPAPRRKATQQIPGHLRTADVSHNHGFPHAARSRGGRTRS